MSKVTHAFEGQSVEGRGHDDTRFLLTNQAGSYLCLSSGRQSRYDGFFWYAGGKMYRVLDDVRTLQAAKPQRIANNFTQVERHFASISETFFVAQRTSGFHLALTKEHSITIDLDARESYDMREWGREYTLEIADGIVHAHFTKRNDGRESPGSEFDLHIAIAHDGSAKAIREWVKKSYETDEARRSEPHERFVYRACELNARRMALGVGQSRDAAAASAKELLCHHEGLIETQRDDLSTLLDWHIADKNAGMAYRCAIASILSLRAGTLLFAGLPWFFQLWNRDTAISLRALLLQKQYGFCKDALLGALEGRDELGRLLNIRGGGGNKSADATGWVLWRFIELIDTLQEDGNLKLYFSKDELAAIVDTLQKIIDETTKNTANTGLVVNGALETWMDTDYKGDTRAGMRIEIQALQIAAYNALFKLTGKKFYSAISESTMKYVRKKFWNGTYLNDGVDDTTIRPNIFIAYYLAPDILSREEWNACFAAVLPALMTSWGGLSTIDRTHPLFTDTHTGEDVRSYHRGDSWFWINNLAALCLYRHDKERYSKEIGKILHASTEDILFHGCIGHHSEVSSASELRAEGCFAQAWSAAMYIELVHEMFLKK